MAMSGAQVTRLGVCGVPRPPYGSFAGKAATEVAVGAGEPTKARRRYTLPDGRRVEADKDQIKQILEQYRSATERDLSKIELPPEVEQVAASTDAHSPPPPASPGFMSSLVELAEDIGPQLVMEVTDDLTKEEAIALGRMIEAMDDDEAVVALLLLN